MLLTAPGKGPLCSKENSMSKKFVAAGVMAASLMAAGAASAAPTEITMWHAMANTLGDWVADVTKDFNAKTPQCHSHVHVQGHLRPDDDVGHRSPPRRTLP